MIIAILGPDGSGKTTIAEILTIILQDHDIVATHYAHRFGVLPSLSAFRLKNSSRLAIKQERAASSLTYDLVENSILRSLLYVSWYGLDYFLGGIVIRFANRFSRKRRAAVFARYFYDYYYQSNNRRLPDTIKRIIEIFVPRPDFILFLNRNAQDIHDGKPELPVNEIQKQQRIIIERFSKYPDFFIVDAGHGIDNTISDICKILSISKN